MFVQLAEWIKPSHLPKSAVLDYWQFTTFILRSCFLTKTALRQVVHRDVSRLLAQPSHLPKSAVLDYWQFTTFTLRSCFLTKTALRQVVHRDVPRLLAQPSHLPKSAVLLTRTEQVCGLPFCLAYTSQTATPPPSARSRVLDFLR